MSYPPNAAFGCGQFRQERAGRPQNSAGCGDEAKKTPCWGVEPGNIKATPPPDERRGSIACFYVPKKIEMQHFY